MRLRTAALSLPVGFATAALAAWTVSCSLAAPQDAVEPVAVGLSAVAPKGAVVLFSGKADDIAANWMKRDGSGPSPWKAEAGVMSPGEGDISTKAEFGDCYLHVEFRPTVDAEGKTRGHGNAGVGMQGRYEIQILDSFGGKPESHGCGAFYSQKAPKVNACKKAGEWQSFDIIYRAPRLNEQGQVTERARATVFQNGILIHNNEDFAGPTGIQYGQFKGEAALGPIILQGDHDPVEFRNIP
ncbi:MAG: DUF1080 domain-containing protein, partial [Armatimonadetes bacterium]|nr:DUF1080 domain-containing protein [Armatimonadota bacterium]